MDFAIKVLSIFIKYPLAYKNTCLYNVVKGMMEMSRKIVTFTPDQLGYKDRGKMKWLGLILSDHTEAIKKVQREGAQLEPEGKIIMTEEDISIVLLQAYLRKVPVAIQANKLKNGHFYPDIKCLVKGINDNHIILTLKDGRITTCKLEDIRNVEFADVNEWYEK